MTLEEFLRIARTHFDLSAPMYVRVHGQLQEITGVSIEIQVLPNDGKGRDARRAVFHTHLEDPQPIFDPMPLMTRMVDKIAPKAEPWESDDEAAS